MPSAAATISASELNFDTVFWTLEVVMNIPVPSVTATPVVDFVFFIMKCSDNMVGDLIFAVVGLAA